MKLNNNLMQKILFFLLPFFGIFSAFVNCHQQPSGKNPLAKPSAPLLSVEGFVVKPVDLKQSIQISGTLKPLEETVLMSDVAGRVVSINLSEGKFVKQGTLLVKLFDEDLNASLKKSLTQLQLAQQTEKRQSEMIKINGISQSDYDMAVLQVSSINADIEILKAQVRKTEVRAPFDGVIGLRNVSPGAQVSPQMPLATIRAVQQLKLDFSVPEKYADAIHPGLKIKFSRQGSEAKYDATVIASERGIEAATRTLKARALVNSKTDSLAPGSYAVVELQLGENKKALMVPTQAIIPQEQSKQLIVARGGKANFLTVKTGVRQASLIEVLDGIAAGDTIVTTGLLFMKPGAALKFFRIIR